MSELIKTISVSEPWSQTWQQVLGKLKVRADKGLSKKEIRKRQKQPANRRGPKGMLDSAGPVEHGHNFR